MQIPSKVKPEEFYSKLLDLLLAHNLPFMVGGTYALTAYTGIERPTKDIDFITTFAAYPQILKVLSEAGYQTEVHDEIWIAKVHDGKNFADVIFAEKNGLDKVDEGWLQRAGQGEVLGHMVKLVPVEEMIRSKAYIQYKERYDGSDVIHLILKFSKTLNWNILKDKMEPNWEILFAHLINFTFAYPNEINNIPPWLIDGYAKRLEEKFKNPPEKTDRVTRGLLISSQYKVAVEKWGYRPISPYFKKEDE